MHLTLRFHAPAQRPACAAFLRGADPAAWLRELGRWQLPAAQLSCYLVPESIRSVQVAGLFVVARGPLPADLLEPYGSEAEGRLFVPVHATLWPATAPGELAATLLWPRQLWHPGIGLVGFDTTDELDLASLLDCGPPRPADWSRARPGPPPRPRLQQVRVLAPTAAEVVQDMRQDVGTAPLTALPGQAEAQPGPARRLLDVLQRTWLKLALALVRALPKGAELGRGLRWLGIIAAVLFGLAVVVGIISQLGSGSVAPFISALLIVAARLIRSFTDTADTRPTQPLARPAAPRDKGRVERWLTGRIQDLEQKRQGEIERLLRLFGENMDEALKYAIPLGGPYQNRGRAPESARLGPRATDFNLGGLGGGGQVDGWDLGVHRYDLQQQYQAAAARELEAGRHKKAAYIYAHLLGDFHAAARMLEQGGFSREAAALYKDHLHDLPAAARCLEGGGLLLEAAELYTELREHEKAGDLYQRLDQPALAARHYERGVDLLLGNDDHPAAARLLAHKLADPGRARQVLLTGWDESKQPEVCLHHYFDVVAAQPDADLSAHVRAIFPARTPPPRRGLLLQVLASINEKHPDPALLAASREVAYEVVGAEAAAGNKASVSLLRHFLPDDRLIAADCSRYVTRPVRPGRPGAALAPVLAVPPLDASIQWETAVTHRHQWVALGWRDSRLHLARGNWYGNVEYYSWLTPVGKPALRLVVDDRHSTRILLRSSHNLSLESKRLPKNKYFAEALTLECPSWLPPWPTRVALLPEGGTAAARLHHKGVTVERYSAEGQPLPPITHYFSHIPPGFSLTERSWPCELIYQDGWYYSYCSYYGYSNSWLLAWNEDGQRGNWEKVGSEVPQLVRSVYAPQLRLLTVSKEELILWHPESGKDDEPVRAFRYSSELPRELTFVGAEYVVTLDNEGAALHHITEHACSLLRRIETEKPPVAVLATASRRQFALLEGNGRLTLHALEE